jgi:hypothetical protein
LFWKKRQSSDNSELFHYESNDRRKFFRVRPSENVPVQFKVGKKKNQVRDIGAAGLSFKNIMFKRGAIFTATIELPGLSSSIKAELLVVTIDTNGFCHCKFKEITKEAIENVHQYVLRRQKEILHQRIKRYVKTS